MYDKCRINDKKGGVMRRNFDVNRRISTRVRDVRKYCLGWTPEQASDAMQVSKEEIISYENGREDCSLSYVISLLEEAGVCPDAFMYFPDQDKAEGELKWCWEHYLYKLGYTDIPIKDEIKIMASPEYHEVMSYKDAKGLLTLGHKSDESFDDEISNWIHEANNHLSILAMTLLQIEKTNNMDRLRDSSRDLATHASKLLEIQKKLFLSIKNFLY